MFFPYSTDAPVYYWPKTTVALIVINVLVFVWQMNHFDDPEMLQSWTLEVGHGYLSPIQWLTTNFMHGGLMHLIGNMVAFWSFGLVVEGKVGPWKALLIYLGICILYGMTVQLITFTGPESHCLGASAIVYGMMAIALIWAPENSMDCMLIIRLRPFFFEVPIKVLVIIFLLIQIAVLILTGGQLSSEFLHAVGAFWGFAVGIWMVKTNRVDCEHWDIFSVWQGRHEMTDLERAKADAQKPAMIKKREEERKARQERMLGHQERMLEEIRLAIRSGHPLPAIKIYEKTQKEYTGWTIPEQDLLQLIQLLADQKHWQEAVFGLEEYLARYTSRAATVRMRYANILLTERKQPGAALRVLEPVDPNSLEPSQRDYFQKLITRAQQMHAAGDHDTYELSGR